MKRFHLIRHAEADVSAPSDHARPLTEDGRAQAEHLGELLADAGVQRVVASSAVRASQTAELLGLGDVEQRDELYNAGQREIARVLTGLSDDVDVVVLVAHLPGVPNLVDDLVGDDADPDAKDALESGFAPATVASFELDGAWTDLDRARLVAVRRG